MTVAELLKLLASLSQVLEASGAKQVAKELNGVAEKMEPFGTYTLTAFATFLDQARNPPQPVAGNGAGRKTQPRSTRQTRLSVEEGLALANSLYARALEADVTIEGIRAEISRLDGMLKADLEKVATGFDVLKGNTKEGTIRAIAQRIIDRKSDYDRARA